jgi:CRISPR-associated protein Cas2
MYVILVYDVNKKRVNKVLKQCRKYLVRVQNSVFEGTITESNIEKLKRELKDIIIPREDTISIYLLESYRYVRKESIGYQIDLGNVI